MKFPFGSKKKSSDGSSEYQKRRIKSVEEFMKFIEENYKKETESLYKDDENGKFMIEVCGPVPYLLCLFPYEDDNFSEFIIASRLTEIPLYLNIIPLHMKDEMAIIFKWPMVLFDDANIKAIITNIIAISGYIAANLLDLESDFDKAMDVIQNHLEGINI